MMKDFNLPPIKCHFWGCLMGTCSFLLLFHAALASEGESPAFQHELRISTFDLDVTPPIGSPLAYDREINVWDLGLRAKGLVIKGSGQPIVLCALDWLLISNEGMDEFQEAMATAAGTVPERVRVQVVHQHDAPVYDSGAEKILQEAGLDPATNKPVFYDGSHENRLVLAERLADGMKRAWEATKLDPIHASELGWVVNPVSLPPGKHLQKIRKSLSKDKRLLEESSDNARKMAWLNRNEAGEQLDVACLTLKDARLLFMPGELFVEYQLAAKALRPDLFVAMAAYGDLGTGYIGTRKAYPKGGYEVSERASFVAPEAENVLMEAIENLLNN